MRRSIGISSSPTKLAAFDASCTHTADHGKAGSLTKDAKGGQRPIIEGTFQGPILLVSPLKARAVELLDWTSSPRTAYAHWTGHLPSPVRFESASEESYALKTNGIFQQAASFFLYDEFCHVQQKHFDFPADHAAEVDAASRVDMEQEEDDFPYRALISIDESEESRVLKTWPILAAVLSSRYLVHSPAGAFQNHHPHVHHRVYNTLAKLSFAPGGKARDYFHYLCATMLLIVSGSEEQNKGHMYPEVFDPAFDVRTNRLGPMPPVSLRAAAGQVELQGVAGEVLHIISVASALEAFKANMTLRVQLQQDVDPDNLNPAAPWIVTRRERIGASSSAVARSLIQGH